MNLKYVLLNKPDSKGYILSDSIYMTFCEMKFYKDINQTNY